MTIHIEALTFDVIIGLLEFERERAQTLIVDVAVDYSYQDKQFIDYAHMVQTIKSHLHLKQYLLLEEALLGLKTVLKQNYPTIQTLFIKLSKPSILPQCNVALSHEWKFKTLK